MGKPTLTRIKGELALNDLERRTALVEVASNPIKPPSISWSIAILVGILAIFALNPMRALPDTMRNSLPEAWPTFLFLGYLVIAAGNQIRLLKRRVDALVKLLSIDQLASRTVDWSSLPPTSKSAP